MTENQRWTIGIVITITIGVLAIYFSINRSRKNLSYQVISFYTTNYKTENVDDSLRIFYNSKEVENIHSLVIEFINNGNSPIRSDDFESDLIMKFEGATKILRFDIIKTIPENINIQSVYADSTINIKPILLNPNDRFMVQVTLTGTPTFPKIYGRIAGVEKVTEIFDTRVEYKRTPLIIWLDGIGGFLLLILSASVLSFLFIKNEYNPFFGKIEILIWLLILYNGGTGLVGYWGENINFMLPKWITLILQFILFPTLVWLFYNLRLVKLKSK